MSNINYEEIIGANIRKARKEKGLSQAVLARKCNISNTTLSAYENKHKTPGLNTVARIAKELGVSIDRLCYGDSAEAIINKASDEGRKIVNCAELLISKGVLKRDAFILQKQGITEIICLGEYKRIIERLFELIKDFNEKKTTYSDPDTYYEQILESVSTEINRVIEFKEKAKGTTPPSFCGR